jgi:hypothetical protein
MRHPLSRWKLEQYVNAGVVTVRMVENAVLCDRGRSHNVLLEDGYKSYKFLGHWIPARENR